MSDQESAALVAVADEWNVAMCSNDADEWNYDAEVRDRLMF